MGPSLPHRRGILGQVQNKGILTPVSSSPDQERSSTIQIHRANHGWVDRKRSLAVLVDGVVAGELLPYGSTDLSVPPGSHQVGVRFRDEQSEVVVIEVGPGETKYLTCLARPGSAWFNPFLLLGRSVRFKVRESTNKELLRGGTGLGKR